MYCNLERLEFEEDNPGKPKGKPFDMSTVSFPTFARKPHAVSSSYKDHVVIRLLSPSHPSHPPFFSSDTVAGCSINPRTTPQSQGHRRCVTFLSFYYTRLIVRPRHQQTLVDSQTSTRASPSFLDDCHVF